jgi:hypothetical protein
MLFATTEGSGATSRNFMLNWVLVLSGAWHSNQCRTSMNSKTSWKNLNTMCKGREA